MTSTKRYTRQELEDTLFTALEASGDSRAKILDDWDALRVKIYDASQPDPGGMSEAELFAMLASVESAENTPTAGDTVPVLAFKMHGASELERFEHFDIVDGTEPIYDDDWPVLTVDAEAGAVKMTIPREIAPYLDPQGLQIVVGVEVVKLSSLWLKDAPAGDDAARGTRPILGSERGSSNAAGEPVGASTAKATVPTAAGLVSPQVAQALLRARRNTMK